MRVVPRSSSVAGEQALEARCHKAGLETSRAIVVACWRREPLRSPVTPTQGGRWEEIMPAKRTEPAGGLDGFTPRG